MLGIVNKYIMLISNVFIGLSNSSRLVAEYRVIHKFLRDFQLLRYSSRDGHAEGEHVKRARYTPSFCPTLQMSIFYKFQYIEGFLIPCPRLVSSLLLPSGETWKYTTAPSTKKKLGEILYILIRSFLLRLSWFLRRRVRNFRRDL
jgi:hypothetical protein